MLICLLYANFSDFPQHTPLTHGFNLYPVPTFWPFTHKSLFPLSRRTADDDSSEELFTEPETSGPLGGYFDW